MTDRSVERVLDHLPTSQEIAAYALLFAVVWGALVLMFIGCLP